MIVSAVRTAVGRAPNGTLRGTRPDELAAAAIQEALRRAPALDPAEIEDVILGCAMPEAEQGLNVARIASLRAGIPVAASAVTVNRFCSSGLQAIAFAAERVMCGFSSAVVAGGTESMSLVPMGGHKLAPNPIAGRPVSGRVFDAPASSPRTMRANRSISRDEQDAFALRSHQRAIAAIDGGRFAGEIVPVTARLVDPARSCGARPSTSSRSTKDRGATRRPKRWPSCGRPFTSQGTVTAGNSSQTSDGAAAVVVTSAERARERGLAPLGRFVAFATAGVEPERFGIGPVPAIRKALKLAGLTLDQIDLVELNEAFAAQVLACLKELPIDPDRLNVNGGAIALGHPLGCTGAKLTTTLLYEMKRRNARYGLVSMCVGGGMGAAGIFERV